MTPVAPRQPEATPAPLAYAPPPRWHRRRRFRLGVLAGLLLCLAVAGWRWGPAGWKQAQFLYWQRQCLAYAPAADHVVYEGDAARAAALLQQPGYVNAGTPAEPVAAYVPKCWAEAMRVGGVPVTNTGFGPGGAGATLFLHERRTASGVRRLVAVQAPAGTPVVVALPIPAPVVVRPATLTSGPEVRPATAKVELDVLFSANPNGGLFSLFSTPAAGGTRFFAGQADPADPSHFTIPFENSGSRGTIEGWLEGDGDRVRLAVTSKAIAPPGAADGDGGLTRVTGSLDSPAVSSVTPGSRATGRTYKVKGNIRIDGNNAGVGATAGATNGGKVNMAVNFEGLQFSSTPLVAPPIPPPATRPTTRPREE